MNQRLKELRKYLGLTQEAFAARIGVKRSTIGNYELNRNEPVDSVVSLVCREFHVNEVWLRTGEGEMFLEDDDSFFTPLALEYGLDEDERAAVEIFTKLPSSSRRAILDYVTVLADTISIRAAKHDTVAEAEELYKKNLFSAQSTESLASPTTAATGTDPT